MYRPGFYFGPHEGCSIYAHHRHPRFDPVGKGREQPMLPQPREYTVTASAVVTFVFSVDIDGTVRIRGGSYRFPRNALAEADVATFGAPRQPADDDAFYRLMDAVRSDFAEGDLYLNDGRIPEPILDAPRMMPGQEPYTPEELDRLHALVHDAALGDPGEAGEIEEGKPR